MPFRGKKKKKNLLDSFSQGIALSGQNIIEDSRAMRLLLLSVVASLTSFLETTLDVLHARNRRLSVLCMSTPYPLVPSLSPSPPPSLSQQVSPATQQMQPTQTIQPPQPTGGRRRRVVDEDPDERRRKFLERNRAAATRCRQKRKVWVMSLEKKAEELTQTNMQLQVQATVSRPTLKGPVYSWHVLPRRRLLT